MGLPDGFRYLPGWLDEPRQKSLLDEIRAVVRAAPLYIPAMPRSGAPFSVQMTNCGSLGWTSDRERGYRYQSTHPVTGNPWPKIPNALVSIWEQVSDYPFLPEACLVNYYTNGAKLGSHRDADEEDRAAPVVSVSLGDDATFHVGGVKRSDPKVRMTLRSGDVVVLGGSARHTYHGIDRVLVGTSPLLREGGRYNLTLRRVTRP